MAISPWQLGSVRIGELAAVSFLLLAFSLWFNFPWLLLMPRRVL
jgi:hypothetical protein